jgi:3-oxoacyl-(acyl-carrier-protein) synthase
MRHHPGSSSLELGRVVITGIGAITPIGADAEPFRQSLLAGKSGLPRAQPRDSYAASWPGAGYRRAS